MFVLDGAAHDQKFLGEARLGAAGGAGAGGVGEGGQDATLDECALLVNNKGQPLISSLTAGRTDEQGRLILQTVVSTEQLAARAGGAAGWGSTQY